MDKEVIRKYLISKAIDNVVAYIMDDDKVDMLTAMQKFYASQVMTWLQNPEDDLYIQSPGYIYALYRTKTA